MEPVGIGYSCPKTSDFTNDSERESPGMNATSFDRLHLLDGIHTDLDLNSTSLAGSYEKPTDARRGQLPTGVAAKGR